MNTTNFNNEASAPANVRPSVSKNSTLPRLDYKLRQRNRQLTTREVLVLLEAEAPKFYALAEVVGKWVWIQFDSKQPVTVTAVLAELGFHWNKHRQSWQHPCGLFRDQSVRFDPRKKYGSYYPADKMTA